MQKHTKYFPPECEVVEVRVERTVCSDTTSRNNNEGVKWSGEYD